MCLGQNIYGSGQNIKSFFYILIILITILKGFGQNIEVCGPNIKGLVKY